MQQKLIDLRLELGYEMWPARRTPNSETLDHLVGQIVEEIGEFRGAVRSFMGRPYSPEKTATIEDMTEEFGDILGTLLLLGNTFQIDYDDALAIAVAKLYVRKSQMADRKNGVEPVIFAGSRVDTSDGV